MSECNDRTLDLDPHGPTRRERMRKLLESGFVKYPKPQPRNKRPINRATKELERIARLK